MGAVAYLAATLALGPAMRAAPVYSALSVVNAASNAVGPLAPYTFVTIYGTELSYEKRTVSQENLRGGTWPTELAGVRVFINSTPALIHYVSPGQVNLIVPDFAGLPSGFEEVEMRLWLVRDGVSGPVIPVKMRRFAPALFCAEGETAIATRWDFTLVGREAPARPGEGVVLFATGLGRTDPPVGNYQIPQAAAQISSRGEFQVLLGGAPVEAQRILYVGIAPGYPGLFQINLRLSEKLEDDPEVRIQVAGLSSPGGVRLAVRNLAGAAQRAALPVR